MTRTYKATGINLKGMPLGESDRLVTILTSEYGLIRAVAPGARKHKSKLRGRTELFVVNELIIAKGRSLDKITQAETLESYPGLSRDLGKLAASQYLAEFVLCLALSDQPQRNLYELLNQQLKKTETLPPDNQGLYAHLAQSLFYLLEVAGIVPQVNLCCLTQKPLGIDWHDPCWRAGFSFEAGGVVDLALLLRESPPAQSLQSEASGVPSLKVDTKIGGVELALLQQLEAQSELLWSEELKPSIDAAWAKVEHVLRDYAQYHLGCPVRSAALVDRFAPLDF